MIGIPLRRPNVDADRIPISSSLPVLEDGHYVWPTPRRVGDTCFPAGARFYTEGDCLTCSRCGYGNSTIAPYCTKCRAVLPLGSQRPEQVA